MPGEVEVPEPLKTFVREWCDGHHERDPEAWAWTDYEMWQRDDMIAAALDAFPALASSIRSQERQRVREALRKLPKEDGIAEAFLRRSTLLAALDSLEDGDGGGPWTVVADQAVHVTTPEIEEAAAKIAQLALEVGANGDEMAALVRRECLTRDAQEAGNE